jgi:hypothetical protein
MKMNAARKSDQRILCDRSKGRGLCGRPRGRHVYAFAFESGLIGHQDPMLSQQILDVAETQGEPDIKPDRLLDDFGREAIFRISWEFGM